ncbi:MAG: hypothetical protein IT379_24535 [Deltaproteobacteria bacterium]|nr:hypothetical protein [Deltaproteobacteria bacterium]
MAGLSLLIALPLVACEVDVTVEDDGGTTTPDATPRDAGTDGRLDARSDAEVADAPADLGRDTGPVDPTLVVVRFDPDGEGFYRMPWPSDARLTAQGTPELDDFPGRRRFFESTLAEIEANVHGFATMPVVYVGLTAAVTEASLPQGLAALETDSPIQMIDLSEAGCGRRLPLEIAFAADGDGLRDDHVLQIGNAIGTVLEPRRPYGLVVLRTFGSEESRSTPRPEAFDRALRDTEGTDALARSLAPLRRCLPEAGVALDDVAVATVFTPQDPVAETRALRDFVVDSEAIDTRDIEGWRQLDAWSRRRLRLVSYGGIVPLPIFQAGESPYAEEGGGLVFDASGRPVVQRWEGAPMLVAFRPTETPSSTPRPVLVFSDGTGWGPWGHLHDNWIARALDDGYVIVSFMPQFHGDRAGFAGNTELSTFNIPNPPAGRGNFRQQAAETIFFARVVRERIAGLPGVPPLDPTRFVYGGHSQGALVGAMVAAVDDQFHGFVLNGLSAFLTLTILHRDDIIDFDQAVSLFYAFDGTLDRFHPLLQLLQLGAEVVDPHNYVRLWHGSEALPRGNHVFVSNGQEDPTTTPRGMEHMTMSADMSPIAPPGWEIDPVGVWDGEPVTLPVSGNAMSLSGEPLTIATYLDATQAHGTIYRRPFVRELASHFWRTSLEGVPRLASDLEYQCGEGADDDLDGAVDCDDPDCAATPPCVEGPCDNGMDEDGNGATDCDDSVCSGNRACRENECGDGMDQDGDGRTDCEDSDCARSAPCFEATCNDAMDDDGDGDVDCDDSDCAASDRCHERNCGDRVDDDRDGNVDCDDDECTRSLLCPEMACDDMRDEDGSGLSDCADPGCAPAEVCARMREMACGDMLDDDGDGAFDCDDADCALEEACRAGTCADGNLGSVLGTSVFSGSIETRDNRYPPGDCTALGGGGDAQDISFAWTAPSAGEFVFSTRGSEIDTILSVLGPDCDPVRELACNDDQSPLFTSEVTVTAAAGETVVVVINAYEPQHAMGNVLLHVLPAP